MHRHADILDKPDRRDRQTDSYANWTDPPQVRLDALRVTLDPPAQSAAAAAVIISVGVCGTPGGSECGEDELIAAVLGQVLLPPLQIMGEASGEIRMRKRHYVECHWC